MRIILYVAHTRTDPSLSAHLDAPESPWPPAYFSGLPGRTSWRTASSFSARTAVCLEPKAFCPNGSIPCEQRPQSN